MPGLFWGLQGRLAWSSVNAGLRTIRNQAGQLTPFSYIPRRGGSARALGDYVWYVIKAGILRSPIDVSVVNVDRAVMRHLEMMQLVYRAARLASS